VQQRGSVVTPDQFRFDFSHLAAMAVEEIAEVQRIVNEKIRHDQRVFDQELPYKQATEEGAIALFDEKYGDVVRVVKIGRPAISAELCGGTHVTATGEIGFFQIITEASIGAGLRRIVAVTGRGAEEEVKKKIDTLSGEVTNKLAELDKERKQRQALERELAKIRAESLASQTEVINGVTVLAAKVSPSRPETLREMADVLRERLKSVIIVLGMVYQDRPVFLAVVTPDLVKKGYHAAEIVSKVAAAAGGGGGGKASLAQGGGKDKAKLDEAIKLVKGLIHSS
jgi:alanyl-tRNA synthetase